MVEEEETLGGGPKGRVELREGEWVHSIPWVSERQKYDKTTLLH